MGRVFGGVLMFLGGEPRKPRPHSGDMAGVAVPDRGSGGCFGGSQGKLRPPAGVWGSRSKGSPRLPGLHLGLACPDTCPGRRGGVWRWRDPPAPGGSEPRDPQIGGG